MKKTILTLALLATIHGAGITASRAADAPAVSASAIHIIQTNAADARANAKIYQWKRVNREVDRLVAAARGVQKALGSDSKADTLKQAVTELRHARLDRDVDRVVDAADKLLALCQELNAK